MAIVSEIENIINFDRQLSNLWELQISDADPTSAGDAFLISRWCKSVSLPFFSMDASNTFFGKKFYNKVTSDNKFTIDIWLDDQFKTFDYFWKWFGKVYNVEEGYFYSFSSKEEYENVAEKIFILSYMTNISTPIIKPFLVIVIESSNLGASSFGGSGVI